MEVYVILSITSRQISANDICSSIGIQFDNCWSIGDFRGKTPITEKNNGCRIVCHSPSTESVQVVLKELFSRISGYEEKIKNISNSCKIFVRCAVYTEDIPCLYFDIKLLEKLVSMKADFDIDLMYPDTLMKQAEKDLKKKGNK